MPLADTLRDIDRLFQAAACAAARPSRAVAAITALATAASVHAQTTFYVDDDAPRGGDGRSWNSAFQDLQDALAAARQVWGGPKVIKIAEGIYSPDRRTGDRHATFVAQSGVTLVGGFAGVLRADPESRDVVAFVTVLTGDLARDDEPAFTNRTDNSYHVVTMSAGIMALDGLTIRGGNADEFAGSIGGGGILWGFSYGAYQDGMSLVDCTLTDNSALESGGALRTTFGRSVNMTRCRIIGNRAGAGGGGVAGDLTASSCEFLDNHASVVGGGAVDGSIHAVNCRFIANSSDEGGAIRGMCLLSACTFLENSAGFGGAAAFVGYGSRADNCLFAGNQAETGGAIYVDRDYVDIQRSTFSQNRAATGGAIALAESTYSFHAWDCIFWENTAPVGPQFALADRSSAAIGRSDLQGGFAAISRGASSSVSIWPDPILDTDPMFIDVSGPDGDPATALDNDYRLRVDSPCIDAGGCIGAGRWSASDTDLAGQPRFGPLPCGLVACGDLGAFEFQPEPCTDGSPAIFVRSDAPPSGDGLSWESAFADLQTALDSPRNKPIWMAGGVYRPAAPIATRPPGDIAGVSRSIVGGFAGTESSPFERALGTHPTIISADRLGNDDGTRQGWSDNLSSLFDGGAVEMSMEDLEFTATHSVSFSPGGTPLLMYVAPSLSRVRVTDCYAYGPVVYVAGPSVTLDGVVMVNCVSSNRYGLWVESGNARLVGCSFEANRSYNGGVHVAGGWADIRNCRFSDNISPGPALDLAGGFSRLVECTFIRNRRLAFLAHGSAVAVSTRGASIDRSTFIANSAESTGAGGEASGGAVWAEGALYLSNSLLVGNTVSAVQAAGGAAVHGTGVSTTIASCTIVGNRSSSAAGEQVGAVWIDGAPGVLASSILWANQRSDGAAGQAAQIKVRPPTDGSQLVVRRCIIDGYDTIPGATDVSSADPRFMDPLGADLLPGTGDEDLRPAPGSPVVDRSDDRVYPVGDLIEDVGDADGDGWWEEATPFDLSGAPRAVRAAGTPTSSHLIIDLGAYEVQQSVCAPDWNGVNGLSLQDLFDFLTDFLRGQGDFNRSGATDLGDIFDFLAAYFAGCP